jgi:hypothetical protein
MSRTLLFACVALLTAAGTSNAQDQKYEPWKKGTDGRWFREYHYKSDPGDTGYKKQYVFWNPKDPNWVYWANPKTNPDNDSGQDKYWARCPTRHHPKFGAQVKMNVDIWCILPKDKRPSRSADLKEEDFPEAELKSPPIPKSKDPKRTITCVPDDLPE